MSARMFCSTCGTTHEPYQGCPDEPSELDILKSFGRRMGYTFEESQNGSEMEVKMIRPDGSVAMIARKTVH